jgi:hypothetical protein
MKENFNKAFELTIGLEGAPCNDEGGNTKFGIAQRYNPEVDVKNLTLEQAKDIYYKKYWLPAGCEETEFPMDICLFDSQVNPQKGGNKGLLDMNPENWQEYMIFRMQRYMRLSKPEYVKGHIFRVLNLCKSIKEI